MFTLHCRFQEVVPLSAMNILGPEKSRISMKWNSIISATLNKTPPDNREDQEPLVGEKQNVDPVKNGGILQLSVYYKQADGGNFCVRVGER